MDPLKPPLDIDIRWDSTFDAVSFVYKYKDMEDDFVDQDRKLRTSVYQLTAGEWERVGKLLAPLQVSFGFVARKGWVTLMFV